MNSKEALNEIKHIVDSSKRPQNFNGKKYLECMTKIEKDLEVLEILKRKNVNIGNLSWADEVKEYNEDIVDELTEQEFKLIKEWLERKE